MSVLIVGLGEVGSALYRIFQERYKGPTYGYDIDPAKSIHTLDEIPSPIDYLHIAIPFSSLNQFVDVVDNYVRRFQPRMIFIHSTVAIGTTRRVYERVGRPVVYTPIRGKHPNLYRHILFWPKWVSALPLKDDVLEEARKHLESVGLNVKICMSSPESLELAKLWETVYRAIMIASWQELHRVALKYGADLSVIAEFIAEVHRVLHDRPVYYPDVIGGHCLIPNTKILNECYPSKLFEFVLESNELRKKEIEDPEVRKGIDVVKRVYEALTNRDYFGM